ncbi:hypothetical protein QL285_015744 [Trifolium repens]|nr:hypothetical protein QL285_015744 [Trifolium repens]
MPQTRATTFGDCIYEAITALTASQTTLAQAWASMASKIDQILSCLVVLDTSDGSQSSSVATPQPDFSHTHRMKLDVPRFDDTDALGWIFTMSRFFEYHSTPDLARLKISHHQTNPSCLD